MKCGFSGFLFRMTLTMSMSNFMRLYSTVRRNVKTYVHHATKHQNNPQGNKQSFCTLFRKMLYLIFLLLFLNILSPHTGSN